MYLTKKIQIKPDAEALKKLWSVSSWCTAAYNAALEQRRDRKCFGRISVFSQKRELKTLKKELPEFSAPSSQVLQNVLFALDRSYKMFFTKHQQGDKKVRPPKFRSCKYFFTQEYSQNKTSFDLNEPGQLRLSYGKSRKDWIAISVPIAGYDTVKTVKIGQDKTSKKYYSYLTYKIKEDPIKRD